MTQKFKNLKRSYQSTEDKGELSKIITDLSKTNEDFVNKIVDDSQIQKAVGSLPPGVEMAYSLNGAPYLNHEAKVVIVGTITPWNGSEMGYYYTSVYNKVYSILDEYFGLKNTNSSLVALKKRLKKASNADKEKIIDEIKDILKQQQIAFIDVIKSAIRVEHNANDDKILLFSLDYDAFKNCDNVDKFICTSNNAADCLKDIFRENGVNYANKIEICPQDRFHYKKDRWEEVLDDVFSQS